MRKLSFILLLLVWSWNAFPQEHAFAKEIKTFKIQDENKMPAKNAILFIGSSSFKKWENLQDYFPGYTVVNRGFGGSRLTDLIYYADDVIIPYHPGQIIVYAGDNDAVRPNTASGVIADRFKILFDLIRKHYPEVPIAFVSIKPSPSRKAYWSTMMAANTEIEYFLSEQKNAAYIDIFHPMLDKDGNARPELFLSDMLHMNEKGYEIWKNVITPFLIKNRN